MGNLVLSGGIGNMTKAVISVWFRVPSGSASAAGSSSVGTGDFGVLGGVLPLIIFGPQYNGSVSEWTETPETLTNGGSTINWTKRVMSGTHGAFAWPSVIGVTGSDSFMQPAINIQTANFPSVVAGSMIETSDVTVDWTGGTGGHPFETDSCDDVSSTVDTLIPSYFGNYQWGTTGAGSTDSVPAGTPTMSGASKWHHLLLSWDLTPGCSVLGSNTANGIDDPYVSGFPASFVIAPVHEITDYISAYSKMWCAIDDANKSGTNLPAAWIGYNSHTGGNLSADPNGMLSSTCDNWRYIGAQHSYARHTLDYGNLGSPTQGQTFYDFGNPTAILDVTSVPSAPLSIPGPLSLIEHSGNVNYKVEMAELQIYRGVTLDTSITNNRRAFVTSDGRPANWALAKSLLNKNPEVYLGGSSKKWIAGTNQGTAGNFTPGGTITAFTPGPVVGS